MVNHDRTKQLHHDVIKIKLGLSTIKCLGEIRNFVLQVTCIINDDDDDVDDDDDDDDNDGGNI